MAEKREYDIVVFGATGYTGRLVTKYLAKNANNVRWAIAGRNEAQLNAIHAALPLPPDSPSVGVIIADSKDQQAIDNMVKRTRVVLSTAGPFALYSTPVVDACVRFGTHYCDTTGEAGWIKRLIDKYHATAAKNGTLIVPSTAFDSIPADLGVFFLANHVQEKDKVECGPVTAYVKVKGAPSGGTIATMFNIAETPGERQLIQNPYLLAPKDKQPPAPHNKASLKPLSYSKEFNKWTVPFLMEVSNRAIVHRSNALFDFKYGGKQSQPIQYEERELIGNFFVALLRVIAMGVIVLFASIAFLRNNVLKRVVPAPGSGPSDEQLKNGWFTYTLVAYPRGAKGKRVAVVKGGDPGYLETSKMVAEAALCLATQRDQLPCKEAGGVVTPAYAMGRLLIDRLNKQGLTFTIEQ